MFAFVHGCEMHVYLDDKRYNTTIDEVGSVRFIHPADSLLIVGG